MAVPVTPAAASSGGIQAECNKIGQWHLYRQMELIRYAQPLLRKPVCAGTAVAAAIAIYAVAGALTSVDQRLSRKADRGWRHHWKSYQTI